MRDIWCPDGGPMKPNTIDVQDNMVDSLQGSHLTFRTAKGTKRETSWEATRVALKNVKKIDNYFLDRDAHGEITVWYPDWPRMAEYKGSYYLIESHKLVHGYWR